MEFQGQQTYEGMTERGRALVDLLALYYRAQLAEALLSERQAPNIHDPIAWAKFRTKEPHPPVVDTLLRLFAGQSQRQKEQAAKKLMTTDTRTGKALSRSDRDFLRELIQPNATRPLFERMKIPARFRKIVGDVPEPGGGGTKDPFRLWLDGILGDFLPGGFTADHHDPNGRPDDAEPGEPEEDDVPPPQMFPVMPPLDDAELRFDIEAVRCIQETQGEIGADEFVVYGIGVNGPLALTADPQDANGELADEFFFFKGMRSFQTATPPEPFTLFSWDLNGVQVPHQFAMIVPTAESDGLIANTDLVPYTQDLLVSLEAELPSVWTEMIAMTAASGTAGAVVGGIAGTVGGPLGTVAGAIIGAAVGALYGVLFSALWWLTGQDELFPPVTASLTLSMFSLIRPPFNESGVSELLTLTGIEGYGGIYEIDYRWRFLVDGLPYEYPDIDPTA